MKKQFLLSLFLSLNLVNLNAMEDNIDISSLLNSIDISLLSCAQLNRLIEQERIIKFNQDAVTNAKNIAALSVLKEDIITNIFEPKLKPVIISTLTYCEIKPKIQPDLSIKEILKFAAKIWFSLNVVDFEALKRLKQFEAIEQINSPKANHNENDMKDLQKYDIITSVETFEYCLQEGIKDSLKNQNKYNQCFEMAKAHRKRMEMSRRNFIEREKREREFLKFLREQNEEYNLFIETNS
ncbi:MAG: hypothetical protein WC436_05370 [Candidatus Babeliales bacterium]